MVDLLDEQRLVEQLRHVEQCPGATDRDQRGLGSAMGFFLASEMLTAISASTRRSISRPDQRGVSVEVAANVLDWLYSSCLREPGAGTRATVQPRAARTPVVATTLSRKPLL